MVDGVRLVLKPIAEPDIEPRDDLARLPIGVRLDRSQSNERPLSAVTVSINRSRLAERAAAAVSMERTRSSDMFGAAVQLGLNKGESIVTRSAPVASGRPVRFVKRIAR